MKINVDKDKRIKVARIAAGMTQNDLAKATGIESSALSIIENGKRTPTIKTAITICKALNRTLDELFWDDDDYLIGRYS